MISGWYNNKQHQQSQKGFNNQQGARQKETMKIYGNNNNNYPPINAHTKLTHHCFTTTNESDGEII